MLISIVWIFLVGENEVLASLCFRSVQASIFIGMAMSPCALYTSSFDHRLHGRELARDSGLKVWAWQVTLIAFPLGTEAHWGKACLYRLLGSVLSDVLIYGQRRPIITVASSLASCDTKVIAQMIGNEEVSDSIRMDD